MGAETISFGPFVLDRSSGTLHADGKPVAVGQRGVALLRCLATADGAVTRATLMEAAWPGTVVEEGNLSVQIAALRKALGTRPDGSEWIVTVPRVGYRLVRQEGTPAEEHLLTLPSVAVLPFDNLGGDPEQDYFADGVVEDIINALSRFKSFAVVARHSSFVYKGRHIDVREVARELGVRYVLEGSVRRSAGQLRITAQLLDGVSGSQLWADKFGGAVDEIFNMQDRVTENVVAIVEPRLKRAEIERARRKPPQRLDAYDLYLRALPGVYANRPERIAEAIELLDRAAERDPTFALAPATAGQAYLLRSAMQMEGARDDDPAQAVRRARAALATGTDDAAVLAMCGFSLVHMARAYDEGFALLRRAVAENPNSGDVLNYIGIACLLAGDLDEGEGFLKRAVQLNPNDLGTHWQLTGIAHIQVVQGRYEEALLNAGRSLAVNAGYDATYWMLIAANAHLGRQEAARTHLERLQSVSPGVTLSRIRRGQHTVDPYRTDIVIDGLRMAGMPE